MAPLNLLQRNSWTELPCWAPSFLVTASLNLLTAQNGEIKAAKTNTFSIPFMPGWSCSGMEVPVASRNTPMLNTSVSQMCM